MREQNRPYKFGEQNRHILVATDGELSVRLVNDASGNLIWVGKAVVGASEALAKWQIAKLVYDANGNLISVTWPQDSAGKASEDYEFTWDGETTTAITGISQANPGVVTMASNPFTDGDIVIIEGVTGMTEVNYDDTTANMFIVASGTGTTFELTDLDGANLDTSGYTAYSANGTVNAVSFANYTFV